MTLCIDGRRRQVDASHCHCRIGSDWDFRHFRRLHLLFHDLFCEASLSGYWLCLLKNCRLLCCHLAYLTAVDNLTNIVRPLAWGWVTACVYDSRDTAWCRSVTITSQWEIRLKGATTPLSTFGLILRFTNPTCLLFLKSHSALPDIPRWWPHHLGLLLAILLFE